MATVQDVEPPGAADLPGSVPDAAEVGGGDLSQPDEPGFTAVLPSDGAARRASERSSLSGRGSMFSADSSEPVGRIRTSIAMRVSMAGARLPGMMDRPDSVLETEEWKRYAIEHWTREELLIAGIYVPCYAIVTRLPMIFAVVHMRLVYAFSAGWCAVFFCAYCVGRMTAAYVVQMLFCMKTMYLSTSTGLIGFLVIWLLQDYSYVFGAMCLVLGLAETVTGFDIILKKECQLYHMPPHRQVMTFRLCMITTTVGSGAAYCLGGLLYQKHGCTSVCILGVAASAVQLIALLIYNFWRASFIEDGFKIAEQAVSETNGTGHKKKTSHRLTQEKREQATKQAQQGLTWKPATLADDKANETTLTMWTVVASMYITPMAVGTNFATLAYFWLTVWDVGTGTSGALMAIGECLGVVVLLFFQRPCVFHSPLTFPFGSPMNICLTSSVLGVCCFLVTLPNIYACALGSVGVHMFNAAIHSFCNELCAIACPKAQYAEWQGRAYLSKRTSNCTMGFMQTLLMAILPQLPHIVAGSAMLGWGIILTAWYVRMGLSPIQVRRRQAQIAKMLERMSVLSKDGFEAVLKTSEPNGRRGSNASISTLLGDRRNSNLGVVPSGGGGGHGGKRRSSNCSLRGVVEERRKSLNCSQEGEAALAAAMPRRGSIQDIMMERMFQNDIMAMEAEGAKPTKADENGVTELTVDSAEDDDCDFADSSDEEAAAAGPAPAKESVPEAGPPQGARQARRPSAMDCGF